MIIPTTPVQQLGSLTRLTSSSWIQRTSLPFQVLLCRYNSITHFLFALGIFKITILTEHQRCVALIMDEMHIREGLVYDKHSGALLGFTDLGNVNNLLMHFERSLTSNAPPAKSLSKSMLVFMVQGLFTRLQFPYAQFACSSVTGDQLFSPFWEGVWRLERCGFMVVVATADGAATNRTFMRIHSAVGSNSFPYKVLNPFAGEERHIHFISDPPHLLKTAQNCWASKKCRLWVSF